MGPDWRGRHDHAFNRRTRIRELEDFQRHRIELGDTYGIDNRIYLMAIGSGVEIRHTRENGYLYR
jgi:hypothetical protein